MCGQIWPSPGTWWHGLSSPSWTACYQQHLLETGAKQLVDQEPGTDFPCSYSWESDSPCSGWGCTFTIPAWRGWCLDLAGETQCSHSNPIKVVAHVYITQCGGFFAQPRHSNLPEWCRTQLKANRWHPLPLRKLSRGTMTSFLAMSCWLCPWHTWLPLTNPSSFWFSPYSTALSFFPLFVFL